jgi:methane monooxygenase component A gamma chain
MTPRASGPAGATPRTQFPPFGDQELRERWNAKLAQITTLDEALAVLLEWRRGRDTAVIEEADFLWIEARIEDRVAVLRFAELSGETIDATTLTGAPIALACDTALAHARAAADVPKLEAVVHNFRRDYKPPIMPTVPFMRTEVQLAELLILRRSKGWYDAPLDELRRRRAATLIPDS